MDICGSAWNEGRNSSNVYNNYHYESDRSQQYVPTLYGNKQNSVREATMKISQRGKW